MIDIERAVISSGEYDNILIVGSGFSLDMVNDINHYINDKTIIIAVNAGISQVPRCDFYLVSNWYSFRKELSNYIRSNTIVICDNDISFLGVHFLEEDFNMLLQRVLLQYKPLFMNIIFDLDLLVDYKNTIPRGTLYGCKGSSSPPFFLSYYLSKIFNIHEIKYWGFDFAYIKKDYGKYYYPNAVWHECIKQRESEIVNKDFDYRSHRILFSGQFVQHFISILMLCLDKRFKEKLVSLSLVDFKHIDDKNIKRLFDLINKENNNLKKSKDWGYKRELLLNSFKQVFKSNSIFYNSYEKRLNIMLNY